MKKLKSLFLVFALLFVLSACGNTEENDNTLENNNVEGTAMQANICSNKVIPFHQSNITKPPLIQVQLISFQLVFSTQLLY